MSPVTKVSIFLVLLASIGVGDSSRPHAQALEVEGVDEVVGATLHHWESLESEDRRLMARVYAEMNVAAALPALRDCAASKTSEATACLLALTKMDDLDSVVLFREKLRHSDDPEQVAVSALTLARWRDRLSYSLLNKALFEGRGEEVGGIGLARAIITLPNGPWRVEYLQFAMRRAPVRTARLMAAARLAQAEGAKWSKPLVGALRGLLAQREGWDEDARLRAQISAWGLSRTSGKGCATLWSLLGGTLENNSGRVAPLLPHIRHSCVRGKGKLLAKHGLAAPPEPAFVPVGETDMPTFEAAPIACDDVRIQVAAMAMNKALWSGGEIPPVVADRIVERLCQPQVQAAGWSVGTVLGMGKASRFIEPGPFPDNAQTRKTVEATGLYPEGFDSFDPHPEQPSWYPKHIKITIDDGPRPGLHTKLHRVLDAHGVKVSFFMCGVNIIASDNKNPAAIKKALERLIEKGHHIAYHSMNHAKGRSEHLIMMTDKQFKDDVDFFRLLLASLVGKEVPLVYGRMPGGLGSYRAESRKAYHGAGLNAPVFWNMGPPAWNAREKLGVVRSLACKLKKKKGDVILLLHETANLENELRVFFERLKQCR